MSDIVLNKKEMFNLTPVCMTTHYRDCVGPQVVTPAKGITYGGLFNEMDGQNSSWYADFCCEAGIYTFYLYIDKKDSYGIITVYADNVLVGTIDCYAASPTANVLVSITNISLATGSHIFKFEVTTKNDLSSNYYYCVDFFYLLKTSAYSVVRDIVLLNNMVNLDQHSFLMTRNSSIIPFFSSNSLHNTYTIAASPAVLNDYQQFVVCVKPGIYTIVINYAKQNSSAIVSIIVDGTTIDTLDMYNSSIVYNVLYTSPLVKLGGRHTIKIQATSKNASSSSYNIYLSYAQVKNASGAVSYGLQKDIVVSRDCFATKPTYLQATTTDAEFTCTVVRGWLNNFMFNRYLYIYTAAPGNWIKFSRVFVKGTYDLILSSYMNSTTYVDIYDCYVAGVLLGTFTFAASGFETQIITGVSVEAGYHEVELRCAHAGTKKIIAMCFEARLVG